jgi:hypothetical protein
MAKKWQCNECGCRQKPKLGTMEYRHPEGGRTVLGRRIDMVAAVHYQECPKCGAPEATSLSLPLDPDADLVEEAFDDLPERREDREAIYAFLRSRKVTPADLEELIRLRKECKDKDGLAALSEWFIKRGMQAPELVVAQKE